MAGLLVLGVVIGYVVRYSIGVRIINSLESKLKEDIRRSKNKSQEIILEAKNKAAELLDEVKKEEKNRKVGLDRLEERFLKKDEELSGKEGELKKEREELSAEAKKIEESTAEVKKAREKMGKALSEVAGLKVEEAKKKLFEEIKEEHKEDLAIAISKLAHERHEEIEKKSMDIITSAIQRYAREHVSEITTSVYTLPSEDLKGKIIGREGRNIRTIERLTGVELIIDETPEAIVISSFDPMRREIARLTLQKLIKDGRIQPAKIEEKVEEAKSEIENRMRELGEEAAYEIGVYDFPSEIIQLLGRLHFRTSFGQNVLTHSVEMAHLAGMIAAELGANVDVAKKGALLHDIGKAIDHEVPVSHR